MRAQVKLEASKLHVGEQIGGILCPSCKGGASGERTLSIKREVSSAKFCCHRASCGWKGAVNMAPSAFIVEKKPSPVAKYRSSDYLSLPASIKKELLDRYEINDDLISFGGIKWDSKEERLVLPIYNRYGNESGINRRSLKSAKPKSIVTMFIPESPTMCWYPCNKVVGSLVKENGNPVLLVEDQFSALKCKRYVTSVALMGTHLSDTKAAELKKSGTSHVIIALDNDATANAANILSKMSGLFDKVSVMFLDKDLKDCPYDEIEYKLSKYLYKEPSCE